MSIDQPPYKTRTHALLTKKLTEALNLLQMRDWQVDLEVGDNVPVVFRDDDNGISVCRSQWQADCLKAFIWISPDRCRKENTDPLFNLFHELAHPWQDVHGVEVRCNILAKLLY
jgi:hypothetical protein